MCIAIYKPENILIDKETLERCYNANSDGAGYMFHKNSKLYIKKGFFSFDDFWKSYRRDKKKETVIHFRIKTHGTISESNCHPYKVSEDLGFVHNGIISGYTDPLKSDTLLFNEDIIQPFVAKWGKLGIFEDPVKKLIENRIGFSKLIFMTNSGDVEIFNEDKGIWDNDVWYSNSSYKKPAPYVPPAPTQMMPTKQQYLPYQQQPNRYYSNKQTWEYKKENAVVGAIVTLTWGYWDAGTKSFFPKNTAWEIVAVNKDYTVDLMDDSNLTEDSPNFIYNIRFSDFEIVEEEDYEAPVEQASCNVTLIKPNGGWTYEPVAY